MTKNSLKPRVKYLIAFVLLFLTEVLIALFVHDDIIRPFGGDVIVIWVVYCFVRVFLPCRLRLLPLWVFLFAVFIEIMQYINIVEILGLSDSRILTTVIGTSFSFIDIVCYALGALTLAAIGIIRKAVKK